jgi:hypothetical protein
MDGRLTLKPDGDGRWTARHERRYVVVRSGLDPETLVLIGSDEALARLAERVETDRNATPRQWFEWTGSRRRATLEARDGARIRASLPEAWRAGVATPMP